ncbi:MAG TPA: EscU/YscU/HrcU family type III secretion system export apparatus switch protein [Spirochaetales bacterium]|nr:EscU/YscU/HrcU family type III secretion system export apparatus switch protein [Spirochaetales bacterium]HRY53687.1 EscU/YscU/HrcU family type III secretion system export apparatus switch protein [Spirochaetia bacterium]HRZ66294.1 EscU/YscU/HrcU family type III secretion system export apparatus switch protein [Spirochaetia bacterium]
MKPKARGGSRPEGAKAVALKYVPSLPAPFLAAKASGRMARRLEEIAREAGVPILEDEALAGVLYPLDLGALVPEECFEIVAKAFAFVKAVEEST